MISVNRGGGERSMRGVRVVDGNVRNMMRGIGGGEGDNAEIASGFSDRTQSHEGDVVSQ